MAKLDNNDLISMKIIFRKLINKKRCGGVHVEITDLKRWGLTKGALKYCINNFLLLGKRSQGNKEYSVNSHKLKEINRIRKEVNDISEL